MLIIKEQMSTVGTCNKIANLRDNKNIHVGINRLLNTFSLDEFQLNRVLKEQIDPCKVKVTEDKIMNASTKKTKQLTHDLHDIIQFFYNPKRILLITNVL